MSAKRLRYVGLALAMAWACWWVFFATAEAVMTHEFGEAITISVVMLGAVAIAWKWPLVGGALLCVAGAASIAMFAPMWLRRFPPVEVVALFAIMPMPPLAAGVLLLLSRRLSGPARHHV